jgi:HAD superfamily hydrolase (TIGR01509 family)
MTQPTPNRPITAVIFDCDGVLIDSEVLSLEIELALLAECGLSYDIPDYKRRFMGLPAKAYRAELTADSLARTGRPLPEDIEDRHSALFRKACEERLRAISGARELADSLRQPKAVASSSGERALGWKLELTGLHDAFAPHIYSAQHVERGKPAPDLFLFAADKIGADPQTTLVIEDSRNGVLAAKAAGMIAAGLTAGAHCDDDHYEMLTAAGADHVFDTYGAIAAFLKA